MEFIPKRFQGSSIPVAAVKDLDELLTAVIEIWSRHCTRDLTCCLNDNRAGDTASIACCVKFLLMCNPELSLTKDAPTSNVRVFDAALDCGTETSADDPPHKGEVRKARGW